MKCKILVVDDAPFIREIIKHHLLKNKNFTVYEAVNGLDAVEKSNDLFPDIILMDLALPKKNGFQSALEIWKKNPKAKILALSSLNSEHIIQQCLEIGFCDFLAKPFTQDQLIKSLNAILKNFNNNSDEVING